jgi:hypothetical protein
MCTGLFFAYKCVRTSHLATDLSFQIRLVTGSPNPDLTCTGQGRYPNPESCPPRRTHVATRVIFCLTAIYRMGDSRDNEGRKVFVGGIPFGVDQNGVREDFGRYGEIEDVYLPTDRATGKLRGFGFITFRDPRDAEEASRVMHG